MKKAKIAVNGELLKSDDVPFRCPISSELVSCVKKCAWFDVEEKIYGFSDVPFKYVTCKGVPIAELIKKD